MVSDFCGDTESTAKKEPSFSPSHLIVMISVCFVIHWCKNMSHTPVLPIVLIFFDVHSALHWAFEMVYLSYNCYNSVNCNVWPVTLKIIILKRGCEVHVLPSIIGITETEKHHLWQKTKTLWKKHNLKDVSHFVKHNRSVRLTVTDSIEGTVQFYFLGWKPH